jgi:hypothetical protein
VAKGDLKIKKVKGAEEAVSFDPRLSQDKKTFVLVVESTSALKWWDAVQAAYVWAKDELDRVGAEHSTAEH